MPTISETKRKKIQEQILLYLFSISPNSAFTSKVAQEVARDEEFTKMLLHDLKTNNLVTHINKNPTGLEYTRRQRWRMSNKAYEAYSSRQNGKL